MPVVLFRRWSHRSRVALCAAASAVVAASACEPATRRPADSVAAFASASAPAAPADTDDFGAPLPTDASHAARIVSLNPTVTELLFAVGAQGRLVGRSAWDEYPAEVITVPSVGDGIKPNIEAVLGVRPTLVILYATADNRAAASALQAAGVRTVALRVDHIAQFYTLCERIGIMVGDTVRARTVRDSVRRTLDAVRARTRGLPRVRVVWPVWQSPVMVIGGDSFLDELTEIAGGENVFHDLASPSPQVSVEEIARRDPHLLVASRELQAKLLDAPSWRAVAAVRERRFATDDPSITGRPSVVLGMAAASLARLLHPELASALDSMRAGPTR